MYAKLDEEHYVENSFLAHLLRLGWKVYRQDKYDPEDAKEIVSFNPSFEPEYGESIKFRESFSKVILEDALRKSIKRINPWIENDQISEVVRRITTPQANSLLEVNREIHDLLLENAIVSENRKTGQKSPTVRFIDFQNPENNSFIAISQFKVNIPGIKKHIIPDIVLFVNGLPLVVVECKSPATSDPIGGAITQLMRYSNRRGEKEGNEKLFWYNLFSVVTCRQTAKYGTITAEYEHFVEWKDPYPYTLSDISPDKDVTSQDSLVQGMLSKENLLDILHSFTIFKEDHKTGFIKVVPRYQQFRAANKIVKKIKEGETPDEKGGIIWHTQGSGKSLTMMYAVRKIYHDPELRNFKIVFVTDRKDLEKQLHETSKSVGFTVHLANTIKELQDLLRTNTPDLVMGMIHKYQDRELKTDFPVLNESPNILIMIDEAHRTQYKLLGANLRKALPNAVRVAFTGTPIEKTEKTFGEYIDIYSIKQAVEDGVTVKIVYEGREHIAKLSNEEEANAKFEDIYSMAEAEEKAKIKKDIQRKYLENENAIRDKAKDMINHYVSYVFPNGFKAQVVAFSRKAAIMYKKALENALEEKIEELKKNNTYNIDIEKLEKLKVGVVISGSPNDEPEYHPYTDEKEHEKIIKSFKLPFEKTDDAGISGDVGIIIVNSMLLTGFDAPIEQVLYLDKVIKGHNLLQAIARVNRVYKNKSCGYVVDYVGIFKHLKEALAIYTDEDIEEISQVVKDKSKSIDELKYIHNLVNEFFEKHEIENWRNNIDECVDLLVDEEIRNEFILLVRNFNKAMDTVFPDPRAIEYRADLEILTFIKDSARNRYRDDKLSIKDTSEKIREILDKYLLSEGIDPKVPPTPLFDEDFIQKLEKKTSLEKKPSKAKAEELKYAIMEYIEKHYEEDPKLYERFSDMVKQVLEEYKDNWDKISEELMNIREKMKESMERKDTFGLDREKERPFLDLLKDEIFGKEVPIEDLSEKDINFLVGLTTDITEIIQRETQKDPYLWGKSKKLKRLRSYIIRFHLLNDKELFQKRNKITQKLMELAYHIYGDR